MTATFQYVIASVAKQSLFSSRFRVRDSSPTAQNDKDTNAVILRALARRIQLFLIQHLTFKILKKLSTNYTDYTNYLIKNYKFQITNF